MTFSSYSLALGPIHTHVATYLRSMHSLSVHYLLDLDPVLLFRSFYSIAAKRVMQSPLVLQNVFCTTAASI
jgi:hypothetical protein